MEFPTVLTERCQEELAEHNLEGFLTGAGDEDADIMFIGEAPGEKEVETGEPFIGRAGKILDTYLETLGLTRAEVYITSVVRSRPYRWGERRPRGQPVVKKINRKPTEKEIFAHAPLLDYQIEHIKPNILVCLGGVALKRLLGKNVKISERHGEVQYTPVQKRGHDAYVRSEETYAVFALYHPAALFYNPSVRSKMDEDVQTLRKALF